MNKKKNSPKIGGQLEQIGYETLERYITNIDELAEVLKKAVWDKNSYDSFRKEFFEVYDKIQKSLIVWKDRYGNVVDSKWKKPYAPNSAVDEYYKKVAENGKEWRTTYVFPKNEYDILREKEEEKHNELLGKQFLDRYSPDCEDLDESLGLNNREPEYINPETVNSWKDDIAGEDPYDNPIATKWYQKLWNKLKTLKKGNS